MTSPKGDPVERAMRAWFRSGGTAQPSKGSCIYEAAGRRYVELWNTNGTLAVYRVQNSGRLKRLEEWPRPAGVESRPMGYHTANNARDLKRIQRQTVEHFVSDARSQAGGRA